MGRSSRLLCKLSLLQLIFGPGPCYLAYYVTDGNATSLLIMGIWVGFSGLLGFLTSLCLTGDEDAPVPESAQPSRPCRVPVDPDDDMAEEQPSSLAEAAVATLRMYAYAFSISILVGFGVLIHGFVMILQYSSSKDQYKIYKNGYYLMASILTLVYSIILGSIVIALLCAVSCRIGQLDSKIPKPPTETAPIVVGGTGGCPNPAVHHCPNPAAHSHDGHYHMHVQQDAYRAWPAMPPADIRDQGGFAGIPMHEFPKGYPAADLPPPYLKATQNDY